MRRRSFVRLGAGAAVILGLGTALLLATAVPAGAAETGSSIIAAQPVTREIDLTTLPRATVRRGAPGEVREIPRVLSQPVPARRLPATGGEATPPLPPAGRPALRLLRQLPGIPFSDVFPPDPNGDVGRAHYVQLTNARTGSFLSIFDKRGRAIVPLLELRSLLGDQTKPCFTAAHGDPIVLYDRLAERWLLSEFAIEDPEQGPFHLCVYVSRSSDPVRGGWHVYDFLTPRLPDYPKYAAWPDAYYVTTNESGADEQPSPTVYALERAAMLRGERARATFRSVVPLPNLPFQALTPAVFEGPHRPPRGRRMPLLRQVDTEALGVPGFPRRDLIQVFEARARFGARPRLEVRLAAQVRVTEFDSDLCGLETFSCIVQPRDARPLDPLREVILWRLSYKNFGASEALVGDFNVDVDGADTAGVRWFDLRRRQGTGWRVNNEGTQAPDPTNRWMGGVAMDREQNIALGYSVSSATVNPGLRFAGRRRADPFGRLREEQILIGGGGVQTQSERWGDYFSMAVDPVDQCTFWFTGEYVGLGNIWQTRIASFEFPGCR